MLADRPHEAAGNGSPRWMAVGPRKRVHRTRPTGQLTRVAAAPVAAGRGGYAVSATAASLVYAEKVRDSWRYSSMLVASWDR